ncbi:MAG TPA: hypothetical protein VES42_23855, partial [Pilimelia sp.]|nr:hypothetical protein [Pilimelia sp.]
EVDRARRARSRARRERLRAVRRRLRRSLRLPDRRTGRLLPRRTRGQRAGIAVFALVAAGAIWLYVDGLGMRLALTVLLVLALPALVVLALDRRT